MHFQLLAQAAPESGAGVFGIFAGLGIIGLLIALVTSIFWIWMLIDCATNGSLDGTQKIVWILVILFLHFIGALIYFAVGRGGRSRGASA
jgi:hypothetical protein